MKQYKAVTESKKVEDIQIQISETVTNIISTKTVTHIDAEIATLQLQIAVLESERTKMISAAQSGIIKGVTKL